MSALQELEKRMQAADLPDLARMTFIHYYDQLKAGTELMIREDMIDPVSDVPDLETIPDHSEQGRGALQKTVMIKLNGGLGTSMGLEKAKSLLTVKDNLSFLDIIAHQVMDMRKRYELSLPLLFMNSFNTEADTLDRLNRHEYLKKGQSIPFSFLQNKVPKIRQSDLSPVSWPENPDLEWCPPGHGDIYTALATSGILDKLLDNGIEYAFVSNSDNLGAVLNLSILGYFAANGFPFLMEVADRTEADRKGGHLARLKNGRLVLRESAQCPEEEIESFQNTQRYTYFNTNNLWLNLKVLKEQLDSSDGILGLPLIRNSKTVDPKDKSSTPVYQLETAMGAAISVFDGAGALRVPRTRFAPVKTTEDLLALWSDCYVLRRDYTVIDNPERKLGSLFIDLDDAYYKFLSDFRQRFPHGAPSLLECEKLGVSGDITFGRNVKLIGRVQLESEHPGNIPDNSVIDKG